MKRHSLRLTASGTLSSFTPLALKSPASSGCDPSSFNAGQSASDPSSFNPQTSSLIKFRPYQAKAFHNKTDGIQVWLWGRQTGKSFTLAAWAIDRLITNPGHTVTVLSNSKFNGAELNLKCGQICGFLGHAFEQVDLSPDNKFDTMRFETRIHLSGQTSRILVLAANPRTARGFSGDLILDEFAFHEDGAAIWNEAYPILASRKDLLCRIASTPNGKHNQFYRMATDPKYPLIKVTRSDAFKDGCPVFHDITREPITPEQARAFAPNKRAYDQSFECVFEDENSALLTHQLINEVERADVGFICEGEWSPEALALLKSGLGCDSRWKPVSQWIKEASDEAALHRHLLDKVCNGSSDRYHDLLENDAEIDLREVYDSQRSPRQLDAARQLFVGVDVGRNNDRTVISVIERVGHVYLLRAMLRLHEMRLPDQQARLEQVLSIPGVRAAKIDMTGIGLGLVEYIQKKFPTKVQGINFASTIRPAVSETQSSALSPQNSSVRITEFLATRLLQTFEDKAIQIPIDATLRDDLRKPERFVSPAGRVSIAATRNEAGHADHFWSLALAINAAQTPIPKPFEYYSWLPKCRQRIARI